MHIQLNARRIKLMAGVLAGVAGLSACTSIGYRCPIDEQTGDYPTACASMQDAMAGARQGTGGKTSVLMDDKGRLVPRELLENKVARPLAGSNEPYRDKSGEPVFHQPKVFQVWTGAFVDAEGNLHDGHTSWFATPGRWAYGSVNQPNDQMTHLQNIMKPAVPTARPLGRIIKTDNNGREITDQKPADKQPAAETTNAAAKANDKAALQALAGAANSAAAHAGSAPKPAATNAKPSAGVTAPALGLAD